MALKLTPPSLRFFFLTAALLTGFLGAGQTEIFNEAGGGSAPSGWSFQNNQTNNNIDRGTYWLVEQGSPLNDIIITDTYDLSSYTSAQFSLDVATFGSSTNNPAIIEFSFDGGANYTQTETTATPTSTAYISGGTFTLNTISNQVVIKITHNGNFGKSVRLRNLVLTAFGGSPPSGGYCSSSFPEEDADAITNVTLNTLNNDSDDAHESNTNGYEDFTALTPTDLMQGLTYNLSVSIDAAGDDFLYHIFAFFDWDGDFNFNSIIEESYDLGDNYSDIGSLSTHNTNITVPNTANLGNTRMRIVIMSAEFDDPDPQACDPQFNVFGETEDYTINIITASTDCTLSNLGLSNITCNNNGTPTDDTDDITSFQLNPTGSNLGATYSVDMDGIYVSTNIAGPFTTDVITGISYGTPTTFYLDPVSAGIGGDLEFLVIDSNDNNCFEVGTITDPGSCSSGGGICNFSDDFNRSDSSTVGNAWIESGDNASIFSNLLEIGTGGATGIDYVFQDMSGIYTTVFNNASGVLNWEFNMQQSRGNPSGFDSVNYGVAFVLGSTSNDITNGSGYAVVLGQNGTTDPIRLAKFTNGLDLNANITNLLSYGDFGNDYLSIRVTFDPLTDIWELFVRDDGSSFSDPSTLGSGDSRGTIVDDTHINSNLRYVHALWNHASGNDESALFDNICISENSIVDVNSDVYEPMPGNQIPSSSIIANVAINVTNSVPVFKFIIEDKGTSDGTPTEVTQLRLVPGSLNTASWEQNIQGVRIVGEGANGLLAQTNQTVIINDDEIIINIINTPFDELTIEDGNTREYTISVFLNESNIIDQEVIQLAIPSSTNNWLVAAGSSQFAPSFPAFEGNPFTIDVVGNGLEFITDASTTVVDEAMNAVQVANTDSNGNIDLSLTQNVVITSSGTLTNAPISVTPINGIATFTNLIHTALGANLTLTASSSGESNVISSSFSIVERAELFFTEVADPSDSFGGNPNGRFLEIFNAGVNEINLSSVSYYFHNDNAGSFQLTGIIPAKGYLIIAPNNADFNSTYGFIPNITQPVNANANGDDALFISLDNTSNTVLDLYGVLGQDGTNEPWFYQDSRAYRNNPTVINANNAWDSSEWSVDSNGATSNDMTPGYGDNDYIYDNGNWDTNIYLSENPSGVSAPDKNIFIKSGTATLTNDTTIGDLVVRTGATLILAPNVKLTVTGDIVNQGTIIFESDDNGSAVLEAVQLNTRVVGNGFEIHRYIPPKRAFRYLSSPVNSASSINANWQEGLTNTGFNYPDDNIPGTAGLGMHITGTDLGPNLGFDATETGNPSMFTWNVASQNWVPIPSTLNDDLEVGKAYAILIRGDRSIALDDNTNVGGATRLRSTGEIHVGDFPLSHANGDLAPENPALDEDNFNLIGNPYQSQVDMQVLLSSSTGLNPNIVYIYDPTIGERGAYATVDLSDDSNDIGPVPETSEANRYLQPNQAFFVASIGTSPTLTFTEATKDNSGLQTGTFSEPTNSPSYLNINLKDDNQLLLDGARVVFGEQYNAQIDDLDALKFWNFDESLSIFSHNTYLSIEKRSKPIANDTTQLYFYNYTKTAYTLQTDWVMTTQENTQVFLVDQYLNQTIEVLPNQLLSYDFTVDFAIPESVSATRFVLIYETTPLSVNDLTNAEIVLYPNPVAKGQSLFIQLQNAQDIQHIQLINLQGQAVQRINKNHFDSSANIITINFIENIPIGVYLLQFETSTERITKKIIFE